MKYMLFSLAFILCSTGIQSVHPMVLAGIRCDWRRSSESNFSKGAAPCRPAKPGPGGMRHIWTCGRPGRRAIGNAKAAIGQWVCSMSTRIRWVCIAEWYRGASLGRGAAQAASKGAARAAAPVVGGSGSGQAASDAVLAKPSLDTRPMRNSATSGNQLLVVPIAECLGNPMLREAQPCWGRTFGSLVQQMQAMVDAARAAMRAAASPAVAAGETAPATLPVDYPHAAPASCFAVRVRSRIRLPSSQRCGQWRTGRGAVSA
ncbi:hypothetical protein [Xanthomonas translucens]|nr:hypothetical protein [Xanthomonas translucens]CCP42228.1 hypothetical protein BN444_03956 [Xanthomonas translucens pv. translucens DSM 18974]MCT8276453.1 hypothetical protein [Xanthomonas translucens pv. translucens]MCT8280252.1 hypothetical protein [Xanthomonas translucens pv. translucens]MCT8295131.1 hypothetical protein [Xanthomonas translucens pv. translucens]MCT8309158.1 hypothetical protein [Xanthomonas translucens pv. translucens]